MHRELRCLGRSYVGGRFSGKAKGLTLNEDQALLSVAGTGFEPATSGLWVLLGLGTLYIAFCTARELATKCEKSQTPIDNAFFVPALPVLPPLPALLA